MRWGKLYEVNESAGQLLGACRTKSEWYEAMSALNIDSATQLDAEDSIRFGASKLPSIDHPAAKFFAGDIHADHDELNDPKATRS